MRSRLGFACSWWHPRGGTWSNTPLSLLTALREDGRVEVVELDAQRSLAGKAVLAAGHRLMSPNAWQYGVSNCALIDSRVRRGAARHRPDAVLELAEVDTPLDVPNFMYQDMGFGVGLARRTAESRSAANLLPVSIKRLTALCKRQERRYTQSAGVFVMSEWFGRWLVNEGNVAAAKVHVVGGGINAITKPRSQDLPVTGKVLFVGRDFFRKGGDDVVAAVEALRRDGSRSYALTVAGPSTWPMSGDVPHWVNFVGAVPVDRIGSLMRTHDVFVLPSRFEAYGLVFLEARAAGLPCVARRCFAMPELVPDGRAGRIVGEDAGVLDIAAAIESICDDAAIYGRLLADRCDVVAQYSWSAVADRMQSVMGMAGP